MRNLLVAATLAAGGCSVNYQGERLFWNAEQAHRAALQDAAAASPAQLRAAIDAFERLARETRGTSWAGEAQMTIARLHASRGEFAPARERYELVLREYDQFAPLCLQARIALARSLEAEGRWADAVRVYEELPVRHAWTVPALEAPVYVAGLYDRLGRRQEAARAYTQAIELYLKWIAKAPTLELVASTKGYLALAYDRRGDWKAAIKTLEELARDPAAPNRPFVLMTLGSLYQTRAEDPERARKAYDELAEQFADHPLAKEAQVRLEHLGIGVQPASTEHGS